jgi:hypothetical protein
MVVLRPSQKVPAALPMDTLHNAVQKLVFLLTIDVDPEESLQPLPPKQTLHPPIIVEQPVGAQAPKV